MKKSFCAACLVIVSFCCVEYEAEIYSAKLFTITPLVLGILLLNVIVDGAPAVDLFITSAKCYDVSFSKNYIKMELKKWSNFTVHIENRGYVYTNNLIMEVNHTDDVKVSPKIVEIHSKNFSSWCHMFHVYASRPGLSKIYFNFGNNSLREKNLHIDVDIVNMRILEPYADWCRKYYYIFGVISVYPQIFLQFIRLSVVGLDMDYVCFNLIGHLLYAVYTLFLFTQTAAYAERNPDEDIPVNLPEEMFAIHGLLMALVLVVQAVRYFGVDKRVTVIGKEIISFYGIVFTFGFLLAKFHIIQYLDFLYICKYIHVVSTSTKYIPQLYKNYTIKSTFGWNIWTSNLESLGCIAIIANLFITSYNYDNWTSLLSDILFWMACVILLQHIAFMVQHYFVYKKWSEYDLHEFQDMSLQEKMSLYEARLEQI